MYSLEKGFEKAVEDGVLPGAVIVARNKSGTLNYENAFGKRSLAGSSDEPMDLNTVFSMASGTKIITTIAVLQVVERGLIGLDDDASPYLPELRDQPVLVGFGEAGKPVYKKRHGPLTLRLLLTHSSGAAYPGMNMNITKWRKMNGLPEMTGATYQERFAGPLAFEPGTSFEYGTGIDWAGKIVEELTSHNLEDYMRKYIFEPLGIRNISFWPDSNPEMRDRKAKMTVRSSTGRVRDFDGPYLTDGAKDCFGGHGSFADLTEYIKILYSILVDDEKLLKKKTAAMMFQSNLPSDDSKKQLNREVTDPDTMFIGEFPKTGVYDWGLGGLLILQDQPGWRKKGRLIWSGMPNIFWFIDREAEICGAFATQVLPPGDKPIRDMITLFERSVYKKAVKL